MKSECEASVARSQQTQETTLIGLRLSVEEGRWLLTAIGIAVRLLEGLRLQGREAQRFQVQGLAALRRIGSQLPGDLSAYYPSSGDLDDGGE